MAERPTIFGILNVTEDSFSDGGKYLAPDAALAHGAALLAEGADVLDVGPASSHPDAKTVSADQEIERLAAVLPGLREKGAPLSVDSYQTETQRWALAQGVDYLNDIQGFQDERFYGELSQASARLIVMHSIQAAGPATRDVAPDGPMLDQVCRFFDARFGALTAAGVSQDRLILDPGMGFFLGPVPEPSVEILRNIEALKNRFDVPVLISVSRKSFLQKLAGVGVNEAGAATLAGELFACLGGADMIRTHEPAPLRAALAVWRGLSALSA